MDKKTKISITVILFLTAIFSFWYLIKSRLPPNIFSFVDIGTYRIAPKAVEVNSGNSPGQSFVSNCDNLFMISIFIPRQNLNSDKELIFHLKNYPQDKDDLVTLKWKYNQIRFRKNDFYVVPPDRESMPEGFHFHFQFPTIKSSKNKEFYFYLESPDAYAGEGIKIGAWENIDQYEALKSGRLFINHLAAKGFLGFRTYNTWTGSMGLLVTQIKNRLLQDVPFLIFYAISLALITSLLIIISLKEKIYKDQVKWKKVLA